MSSEVDKAIEQGAVVEESGCLCFACKHSMVFLVGVKTQKLNHLTGKPEVKEETKPQAICCRWGSPMPINIGVKIHACTEFMLGPVKSLKNSGDFDNAGLTKVQ